MPAIGTSSDQYQNRDPALTTYRRNMAAPALPEAMAERSEDRSKAAAVERRQVEGRPYPSRPSQQVRQARGQLRSANSLHHRRSCTPCTSHQRA